MRKRKLAHLGGCGWASDSAVEKLLSRLDLPGSRRAVRRAVCDFIDRETYYGKLLKKLSVPASDGGEVEIDIVCPFALLRFLCEECSGFAAMILAIHEARPSSPDRRWRIVFYSDEWTGGNMLSHEQKRKAWGFYWNVLEFPSKFFDSDRAWLVASVVRTTDAKDALQVSAASSRRS